mmetsp:Transcript_232/g.303  ORF Transcript_232/g.303 Transcript_232/m.303 type:complete len:243 (-) Transcript_232:708-1436(-)
MKVIVVSKASEVPRDLVDEKPTFVYWNILGLAQAIRLTLAAAKVDFVDVRIEAGDPALPESYKQAWMKAKPSLPLLFPNLPYYMDENVKISQSNTILRYLGRQHNMMGPKEYETDLFLDELSDLDGLITSRSYGMGDDAVFAVYKEHAADWLTKFQPFLDKSASFLSGSEPTVADMKFYVFLHKLSIIQEQLGNDETASILGKYWVSQYKKRVETWPGVEEYMASPEYMKSPMNNPSAKWRG